MPSTPGPATARPDAEGTCAECAGRLRPDLHGQMVCERCHLVDDLPPFEPGPPAAALAAPRGINGNPNRIPRLHPRLLRLDRRARSTAPRSRARARILVATLSEALTLPRYVAEDALLRFRRAQRGGVTRGRSLDAVIAACVAEATRDAGIPRTIQAISTAAGVAPRTIHRQQRMLAAHAGERVIALDAVHHVHRIASAAGAPPAVASRAAAILRSRHGHRATASRHPDTAACAALVLAARAAGKRLPVARIARAGNVSRQTVHAAIRDIEDAARDAPKLSGLLNGLDPMDH